HPGVTATFCEALSAAGINIETMNTSEIRISVLCREEQLDLAVAALHGAFELGGDEGGGGHAGPGGSTMIEIIDGRESVPWSEIRLVASARSAGKVLRVRREDVTVQALG